MSIGRVIEERVDDIDAATGRGTRRRWRLWTEEIRSIELNRWLLENQDVEVVDIRYAVDVRGCGSVLILYREEVPADGDG